MSRRALHSLRCLAVHIEVSGSFSKLKWDFVWSKISIGLGVGDGRRESLEAAERLSKGEGVTGSHTERSFKLIDVEWQLCSSPGNLLRLAISKWEHGHRGLITNSQSLSGSTSPGGGQVGVEVSYRSCLRRGVWWTNLGSGAWTSIMHLGEKESPLLLYS